MKFSGLRSSISFARLAGVLLFLPVMARADVPWVTDFGKASGAAMAAKKPILVDFYAEWCGPCKAMEHDAFGNPTVQALLKKVVCVRLNVDNQPPLAQRFSVNAIPRVILLSPDGKNVLLDTTGYHDAEDFASELGGALGLKVGPVAKSNDPPQLIRVRDALTSGSFAKLKATDVADANAGLALLVGQLGVFDQAQFDPIAALIKKAGKDAVPALLDGMGDSHLAVRVGSYRVLQSMVGGSQRVPAFDPWAKSAARANQLSKVRQWFQGA